MGDQDTNDTEVVEEINEADIRFDLLKAANCFKHTTKMAKVMEGKYGGGFYAAIYNNRSTRKSEIVIAVEYQDGEEEIRKVG